MKSANSQSPMEAHAKVVLIAKEKTMQPGKPLWIGIQFHLDEGWHIYWQNAGDSGEPPKVQWELPPGFAVGPIQWPQPVRLGGGSIIDYGYEGEVLLMAPIDGPPRSEAISAPSISAGVKYIVCREICVPGKAHLQLSFPEAGDTSKRRTLFGQARARLPKPAPASWRISAESDKDRFLLSVRTNSKVQRATFLPITPGEIENSALQRFVSTGIGFRLELQKSSQLTKSISILKGLVVLGPDRAFEITAPVVSR
ncbi:MAG TPA: protein-disulfide reductase DsbD domain-containing protein [Candidatus Dormibacteraeota bacterium]|nr:protein-disulfide reductase DsbD domain-containing protein [Candidatus Dormibacteraeota bacterium]